MNTGGKTKPGNLNRITSQTDVQSKLVKTEGKSSCNILVSLLFVSFSYFHEYLPTSY